MSELNPEAKKQVEEALAAKFRSPMRQFNTLLLEITMKKVPADMGTWRRLATLYTDAVRALPSCFWAQVFENVEDRVNPIFHTRTCSHSCDETDACDAGHPWEECNTACQDYNPVVRRYCDEMECKGDCANHPDHFPQ